MSRSTAVVVVASVLALHAFGLAQSSPAPAASPQAGSAPSGAAQPSITGTIAYRERMALPPDAAIDVKLQDVTYQEVPAKTIVESVFAPGGKQVPIPFQLTYHTSDINQAHIYQVRASISVKGKLMFSSNTAYPVITKGAPSLVTIMLQKAPASAPTAAGDKLRETDWILSELGGKPPVAVEGKPAHLMLHRKGKLAGSTGCNTLMGTYIASEGALQFSPAGVTMKMCAPPVVKQEQAFLAALKATTAYKIDGDTLELMSGEQVLAKLEAGKK